MDAWMLLNRTVLQCHSGSSNMSLSTSYFIILDAILCHVMPCHVIPNAPLNWIESNSIELDWMDGYSVPLQYDMIFLTQRMTLFTMMVMIWFDLISVWMDGRMEGSNIWHPFSVTAQHSTTQHHIMQCNTIQYIIWCYSIIV